jgi:hypothetical protein
MRGRRLAAAIALTLTACAAEPTDAEGVLDSFDGSDTPILVVTRVCYSICSDFEAYPSFGVYADRSMVSINPTGPNGRFESARHILDDTAMESMAGLMVDAGLTVGGVRATATNYGIADGGGVVFETLINGTPGYVHAPFLESEPVTTERTALLELMALLEDVAGREAAEDLTLRWVVIGKRSPDPNAPAWPGDEIPSGDPPCFELDTSELADDLETILTRNGRYRWFDFANGTHVVSSRPLLPHESGCEAAQAMLVRFAENDAGLDLGGTG